MLKLEILRDALELKGRNVSLVKGETRMKGLDEVEKHA